MTLLDTLLDQEPTTLQPKIDYEDFIKRCSLKAHELPIEVREKLYNFKLDSNQEGYVLFKDLDTSLSKQWLTIYGSLLGTPYSYVQEGDGHLIHEITPRPKYETEISSKSSAVNLDFHTELAFHHIIPDYLLLFCVRGDRHNDAQTYVSSVRTSINDVSSELFDVLRQPLYKTGVDVSFGNVNTVKGNGKVVPVLYGDLDDPLMIFDPDMMVPLNDAAENALKEFRAILFKNKTSLVLQPGDLVMIDNNRAVHGRSAFRAYYDGQDRYLHRLFITRDLTRAQMLFSKKERIITYEFE